MRPGCAPRSQVRVDRELAAQRAHLVARQHDGGSSDNTLALIEKYADAIDYYVSETDDGIYAGMNKGLELAQYLQNTGTIGAAIDVIAQKDQMRVIRVAGVDVGIQSLKHRLNQIGTSMDVAHRIDMAGGLWRVVDRLNPQVGVDEA